MSEGIRHAPLRYLARIHGALRRGGRMASPMVAQHMVGKEYVRAMGAFLTDDSAAVRLRRGLLVAMVAGVQYAPGSAAGVALA